jgi:1,4-dihydroxy-2-naphthoate octaprenyltransferase
LIASLVPFFLVSNLLLLNQFPDVEADQAVGRKHYPIQIGKVKSSRIYLAFLILPFLAVIAGVISDQLPLSSLLGLFGLVLAVPIIGGVLKNAENTEKLIPTLGQNVLINLLTPVLVAVGIMIGWSL